MNWRKAVNSWAKKHDESAMEQSSRLSHSDAYHGFFEGYTEFKVVDPSGHGSRIERIYTGVHYRSKQTRKSKFLYRFLYALLFILSVVCFCSGGLSDAASNKVWYAALPQAGALPMFVWFLIGWFYNLPVRDTLEIGEYKRSSVTIRRSTMIGSICLLCACVMAIISIVLEKNNSADSELVAAGLFLVSALSFFVVNRMESGISYERLDSTINIPEGGVEID